MKRLVFVGLMLAAGVAFADQYDDANEMLRVGSYPAAIKLLTSLADGGDARAQLTLGELMWYGRGTAVDAARAKTLFTQSASRGNAQAAIALRHMDERDARKADIAYWVNGYDGAELTAGKFACAPFKAPESTRSREEADRVIAGAAEWRACHNAFVANLNAQAPIGSRIPADVEVLMTDAEVAQAKDRLTVIYRTLSARARQEAADMLRDYSEWQAALSAPAFAYNYENLVLLPQRNSRARDDHALPNPVVNSRSTTGKPKN